MSTQAHQIYQSFLVRCWFIPPATADELGTWRFELQEISATNLKHLFSDLEQLHVFMTAKLTAVASGNDRDGG